jgi:hypothetical protein
MKCYTGPRTDSLDKQAKLRKMHIRFGTWDVRSLYGAGSLLTVAGGKARRKETTGKT